MKRPARKSSLTRLGRLTLRPVVVLAVCALALTGAKTALAGRLQPAILTPAIGVSISGTLKPGGTATATVTSPGNTNASRFTYLWRVNGIVARMRIATQATSDSLPLGPYGWDAVVSVVVIPSSGARIGIPVGDSATLVDHPPVATVALTGPAQVGSTVTANATGTDPDGSPVTFTYVWLLNGAQMQVDANLGSHDDYAIDGDAQAGQTLTVRVIPNDGYMNGPVASDSAVLTNPASQPAASQASSSYDPASDPYSMYETTLGTGAQAWWRAGYTGKGVDVAVIDTGVSPVEGLDTPGKIVYGPDLSLDSQAPNLGNLDANGHGTFMAGLIAGRDSSLQAPYTSADASVYRGMAPDARIVSVKVGDADGGVDVTQVIAAIDWVVQHAHDPGLNIRVINLAYGTNSTQPYLVDPLAFAVEQAWKAGIVVVAAAGNTGYQVGNGAPGVADPAYDPFIIGVGGYDTMGTTAMNDDRLGGYSASSSGCSTSDDAAPLCKGPDFLEDGSHLQGLRDPGSYVDDGNPSARLGTRYFRGSGTSEATAIAAGAVALILQKYPDLTPDQVKQFLISGADPIAGVDSADEGAGEIDLGRLLGAPVPAASPQSYTSSNGSGTIEGSRGQDHLTMNGVELKGEEDIFGKSIDTAALASQEAADASWTDGVWNGSTWSGSTWSGSTWSGSTWSGSTWSGSTWSGNTWSGNTWSGSTWSGSTWSGSTWSGNTWSGSTWSGSAWASGDWD
jgi:subtilisin family serine protease